MTRHLATLRARFQGRFQRWVDYILSLERIQAHCRLVVELRPWPGEGGRTWLQVVHCSIFRVVTVPEGVTLVPAWPFGPVAVAEALGGSRNLTVLQRPGEGTPLGLAFPGPLMTLLGFES